MSDAALLTHPRGFESCLGSLSVDARSKTDWPFISGFQREAYKTRSFSTQANPIKFASTQPAPLLLPSPHPDNQSARVSQHHLIDMPFVYRDSPVALSSLQDKYGLQAAGLAPTPALTSAKAKKSPKPSPPPSDMTSKASRFSLSRVLSRKRSDGSSSSSSSPSSSPSPEPRLSSASDQTLAPPYTSTPDKHSKQQPTKDYHGAFASLSSSYGYGGGVVSVPVLPYAPERTSPDGRKGVDVRAEARYTWSVHRA